MKLQVESVWKSFGAATVLADISLDVAEHEVVCLIGASGSGKSTLLRCINLLDDIDDGRILLDGVDLTVEPDDVVCLIGASGSGKSTLLRCVDLLEDTDDGTVWFEGRDVSDPRVDRREVRKRIGVVFQAYNLFPHLTVLANVTLAPRKVHGAAADEARDDAMRLLGEFGLSDTADVHPGVGDVLPLEPDRAVVGALEQVDAAQQRGLAAARGADEADDVVLVDGQVQPGEHHLLAVRLAEPVDAEDGPGHSAGHSAGHRAGHRAPALSRAIARRPIQSVKRASGMVSATKSTAATTYGV